MDSVFPAPLSPLKMKTVGDDLIAPECIPDDDTYVLELPLHEVVSVVSYGKDVWRLLPYLLILVLLDVRGIVDGEKLVWVDGH